MNNLNWQDNKAEWEQDGFFLVAEFVQDDFEIGGIVVKAAKRLPDLKGGKNKDGWRKIRGDIMLAECALWGIESDSGEDYFTSTARELAAEAIEEAKQTLADLCASR